jgi:TonB family protein
VDISADPYRVRLPGGLNRVAGTLETLVRICVDTTGAVSGVTVVRSADPALDRQLASTIPRWRYRPLLDTGRAIPFCYTMNMRFVAGGY